jgi:phosphoribosylformimino-5-aminoimidazole carboxamide ribonucleotide (ProFAR) isomerase
MKRSRQWLAGGNKDLVYDFIQKYIDHGVKQIFCTDVSKDGN